MLHETKTLSNSLGTHGSFHKIKMLSHDPRNFDPERIPVIARTNPRTQHSKNRTNNTYDTVRSGAFAFVATFKTTLTTRNSMAGSCHKLATISLPAPTMPYRGAQVYNRDSLLRTFLTIARPNRRRSTLDMPCRTVRSMSGEPAGDAFATVSGVFLHLACRRAREQSLW